MANLVVGGFDNVAGVFAMRAALINPQKQYLTVPD